jgi:hypothetical protein
MLASMKTPEHIKDANTNCSPTPSIWNTWDFHKALLKMSSDSRVQTYWNRTSNKSEPT